MSTSRRGIALVETILYVALVVLITALVAGTLISMTRTYKHFRASRDMSHAASVSVERMMYEIKQADDLAVGSVFATDPGRLALSTVNESGVPVTLEFYSSSTQLILESAGIQAELLPDTIELQSLIFRDVSTSNSKAVKVELTLADSRSLLTPLTISATAALRGSY